MPRKARAASCDWSLRRPHHARDPTDAHRDSCRVVPVRHRQEDAKKALAVAVYNHYKRTLPWA